MQLVVHRICLKLDAPSLDNPFWVAKGTIPDAKMHDIFRGKFRRGPGFSNLPGCSSQDDLRMTEQCTREAWTNTS